MNDGDAQEPADASLAASLDVNQAEANAHVVVLADPEARDASVRALGVPVVERLASLLSRFDVRARAAPGVRGLEGQEGDAVFGARLPGPTVCVYDSTVVTPELLGVLLSYPVDRDEVRTAYDERGRPAACVLGAGERVPRTLVTASPIDWPDGLNERDICRLIYADDRRAAERTVLRSAPGFRDRASFWAWHVERPVLHRIAAMGGNSLQVAWLSVALSLASFGCALAGPIGVALGALCVALAVTLARVGMLQDQVERAYGRDPRPRADTLAAAKVLRIVRPVAHAALVAGVTYDLVFHETRSLVASGVRLAVGASASLLSLVHARDILRGDGPGRFPLPSVEQGLAGLGVRLPPGMRGAPVFESILLVAACLGAMLRMTEPVFGLLAASCVVRLWRWFSAPVQAPGASHT